MPEAFAGQFGALLFYRGAIGWLVPEDVAGLTRPTKPDHGPYGLEDSPDGPFHISRGDFHVSARREPARP